MRHGLLKAGHQSRYPNAAKDSPVASRMEPKITRLSLGTRNVPVSDLLQLLVRREFLTNYQVERVVNGDASGFFFGSYKVLYLVGAGSFARVFPPCTRRPAPWWR